MVDMSQTIAPKSDQINADDLIGGPRTITVSRVTGNEGNSDQPVNVFFEGHNLPFRPCKSMRRVMVKVWGSDASKYVGRSMTIYRDPKVKWGGMEVGGIRISHMSGISKPEVMALTETRAKRAPYKVMPLVIEEQADKAADWADGLIAKIECADEIDGLDTLLNASAKALDKLAQDRPELHEKVETAITAKREALLSGTNEEEEIH